MAATALDLGLRGAAVGLTLEDLCAPIAQLAVPHSHDAALRALRRNDCLRDFDGPVFSVGDVRVERGAGDAVRGLTVVFWLWALAVFDDGFVVRPYHLAIWLVVTSFGIFAFCGWTTSPVLCVSSGRLFAIASICFPVLAVVQTLPKWRLELVAGRRLPLLALLLVATTFSVVNAACGLAEIPWQSVSLGCAVGVGLLAILEFGPRSLNLWFSRLLPVRPAQWLLASKTSWGARVLCGPTSPS